MDTNEKKKENCRYYQVLNTCTAPNQYFSSCDGVCRLWEPVKEDHIVDTNEKVSLDAELIVDQLGLKAPDAQSLPKFVLTDEDLQTIIEISDSPLYREEMKKMLDKMPLVKAKLMEIKNRHKIKCEYLKDNKCHFRLDIAPPDSCIGERCLQLRKKAPDVPTPPELTKEEVLEEKRYCVKCGHDEFTVEMRDYAIGHSAPFYRCDKCNYLSSTVLLEPPEKGPDVPSPPEKITLNALCIECGKSIFDWYIQGEGLVAGIYFDRGDNSVGEPELFTVLCPQCMKLEKSKPEKWKPSVGERVDFRYDPVHIHEVVIYRGSFSDKYNLEHGYYTPLKDYPIEEKPKPEETEGWYEPGPALTYSKWNAWIKDEKPKPEFTDEEKKFLEEHKRIIESPELQPVLQKIVESIRAKVEVEKPKPEGKKRNFKGEYESMSDVAWLEDDDGSSFIREEWVMDLLAENDRLEKILAVRLAQKDKWLEACIDAREDTGELLLDMSRYFDGEISIDELKKRHKNMLLRED